MEPITDERLKELIRWAHEEPESDRRFLMAQVEAALRELLAIRVHRRRFGRPLPAPPEG